MAETDEQPSATPSEGTDAAPRGGASRRTLTVALGVLALFAAGMAFNFITRGDGAAPTDEVAGALAARAPALVGLARPGDLQHARCVKTDVKTDFICKPVADTAVLPAVRIRWKDQKLTRKLEGSNLREAPRSGDLVAAAIGLDDAALYGTKREYGCAYTSHRTPAGGSSDQGVGGFICVSKKKDAKTGDYVQRYVEFAPDGTVTQDFPTAI